jgi:peptide deformylase
MSMPAQRILELGDPRLRSISSEVKHLPDAFATLDALADTLHEFQRTHGFGRGIAAIQIGIPQRVIYIEIHGERYEIINPRFVERSAETFTLWDDCFSFPNLMVHLERAMRVEIVYWDRQGREQSLSASDDFAELLQHEIDHLDGILAIDRALEPKRSFMTRNEYLRTRFQHLPRPS